MKIKCHDSIMRDVMKEIIQEGVGNYVFISTLIEPTEEDIKNFTNISCDHNSCKEQLIWDDPSWLHDNRYCAICGESLGTV